MASLVAVVVVGVVPEVTECVVADDVVVVVAVVVAAAVVGLDGCKRRTCCCSSRSRMFQSERDLALDSCCSRWRAPSCYCSCL